MKNLKSLAECPFPYTYVSCIKLNLLDVKPLKSYVNLFKALKP